MSDTPRKWRIKCPSRSGGYFRIINPDGWYIGFATTLDEALQCVAAKEAQRKALARARAL